MRALSIDFSWQGPGRSRQVLKIGAAILIVIWCFMGWRYATLQAQLQAWDADHERLIRRQSESSHTASADDRERLRGEFRQANRTIDALARPWDDLFSAVDNAYDERATLLAIDPDTERLEVRLTVEAKDYVGMLAYLRRLRAHPVLADALLEDHQINQQDPQRPIRFVVRASWTPRAGDGRAESKQ